MRFVWSVVLYCITLAASYGQHHFKHLNSENGLSNNTVLTILQDSKGFMWFGTDDGLNKYDGHSFRIFKPDFKNKKGINHNIAKILFEDHAGNIWIGTDGGGLNKFDPITESFTSFYYEEGDLTGLSHNNVTSLAEENDRYLWIGTYGGGLNRLDLRQNTIEHYSTSEGNSNSIASHFINCLALDKAGNLWIGTWGRGLDRFNLKTKTFTHFQYQMNVESSLSDNTVNCISIDQQNNLWIGTWEGGLNRFDAITNTFSSFSLKKNNLSTNNIRSIAQDKKGILWMASFGGGVVRFDPVTKQYQRFLNDTQNQTTISSNNVWTAYFSNDNILWLGCIEAGINKLDFNKQKILTKKNLTPGSSQPYIVDKLMETSDGNIFTGTFDKGLIILDSNLNAAPQNKYSSLPLPSIKVNSVVQDKTGIIWIGTEEGITTYNPEKRSLKNYSVYGTSGLSFNAVRTLYEDHTGTIWIGTWGGGLNKYDRATDTFKPFFMAQKKKVTFSVDMSGQTIAPEGIFLAGNFNRWDQHSIPLTKIKDHVYQVTLELTPQKIEFRFLNGSAWEQVPAACAFNKNRIAEIESSDLEMGVIHFSESCTKVITIPKNEDTHSQEVLTSNHIWCVLDDHDGILWIGTNEGLNRYDRINNTFTPFKRVHRDSTSLSDDHVSCIFEDSNFNLWIGTLGGGLNQFDRKTNTFINFNEEDGLANNIVKGILEDDHQNLWISTNNGLSKFNYTTHTFKNYNSGNGLDNSTFRIGAVLKRKNGEMLFGGTKGLTYFHPDSVATNLRTPKVYITELLLFNHPVSPKEEMNGRIIIDSAVMYSNLIRLSYQDNMISVRFSSPEFSDDTDVHFQYKMDGFDKQWYEATAGTNLVSYTNLPHGKYRFMVKASDSEGVFGQESTHLDFYITPPFWDTLLFKIVLASILVSLIYGGYKFITSKKEAKLKQATLVAQQQVKALENEKLQNEIDYQNKELATISMNLIDKTKFLNEQVKKLETVAHISDQDVKSKLNNLIDNFNKEMTTEKDWEYFEIHFDKVHQNFLSHLKTTFPELSSIDIRLAAFIRMNLSNKEIADLMNKSVRSIESSRYRLRKNLNLNHEESLTDFLFRL